MMIEKGLHLLKDRAAVLCKRIYPDADIATLPGPSATIDWQRAWNRLSFRLKTRTVSTAFNRYLKWYRKNGLHPTQPPAAHPPVVHFPAAHPPAAQLPTSAVAASADTPPNTRSRTGINAGTLQRNVVGSGPRDGTASVRSDRGLGSRGGAVAACADTPAANTRSRTGINAGTRGGTASVRGNRGVDSRGGAAAAWGGSQWS
jgi:hypothetical protein